MMQAFCPQPSTPDLQVGTCLAMGFANVLPQTPPPCLTKTEGVVRSDTARLPFLGIEAFYKGPVVRSLVYRNTTEYHDHLCDCQKLTLHDLFRSLESQILEREQ